jgi:hypothetical protein
LMRAMLCSASSWSASKSPRSCLSISSPFTFEFARLPNTQCHQCPRFPIEIYRFYLNWSTENFRKKVVALKGEYGDDLQPANLKTYCSTSKE